MGYRAHHVGRVRIAAAKVLTKCLGFEVRPEDVHPAQGAWRTDRRLDVYCWELFTKNKQGHSVIAGCWERMTEFVRDAKKNGCYIHDSQLWIGKAEDH